MSDDRGAPEKMSRRDEIETLLPFYLNGTLEGADLEAVEQWLASDPGAMAALDEAEAEFSSTTAANEAIRPPADALSRFAARLDAEAGPVRAPARSARVVGFWGRLRAVPAGFGWAAAAVLLVFVLAQAALETGGKGPDFEIAGAGDDVAKMPFALVKFKADARMADVSAFLSANGLKVIGGPNADGVFRLGIPAATAADYDRLFGLVAAQPFADTVLAGRKPADAG